METTTPNVYAVGDAIGGTLLAHAAIEEGVVAAESAMGINCEGEDRLIPLCIFTYPDVEGLAIHLPKSLRSKA